MPRRREVDPIPQRKSAQDPIPCGLCQRPFVRSQLTRHHTVPRERGGTGEHVELVCSQCHGMVHATFTNATLAMSYPTLDQLRAAPELAKFLTWVRKQPPTRRKKNVSRKRKL
jgi:5-methylcytosine-specific restriction endonuclease McrA